MPVFVLLVLASVPLTWILARTYVKVRQLEASRERDATVLLLEHQVRDLNQRVETLETIAVSDGPLGVPVPRRVVAESSAMDLAPRARRAGSPLVLG